MWQASSRPWPSIWITYLLFFFGVGNPDQRPVTHSLTTVVVVVLAAAASRRHWAVLAGAAVGLLIHFARDIAEGPPGVRMLWPLSNTAWTASARWFWAMIIVFTVVRLTVVTLGIPRTRIRLFLGPVPGRSRSSPPIGRATSGDRNPAIEMAGSDRAGADESSARLNPAAITGSSRREAPGRDPCRGSTLLIP